MKETRKLKKRNLHDAQVVEKLNGEETDRKMHKKKKEKLSNVDLSTVSSEKPKVELKKIKRMADEINSSPANGKLSGKMKQRKAKGGNVEITKHSQPALEAISNEKVKGTKGKINKTKKKRKADEITGTSVDDHLIREVEGNKGLSMADNGTQIRNCKSKKSNKKKKMDLTSSDKRKEIEEEEDVYQISSGDEDCSRGMKRWVTAYYESRPGLDELQNRIDDFITAHEKRLEEERQNREAKAAEGGWTVVVHHKGRKKTTDSESGIAVGSVSQAALEDKVANKKQSEPVAHGFYRFQRREAQRNEILTLQSKFEQDKKRIQQLRAARKFKPY